MDVCTGAPNDEVTALAGTNEIESFLGGGAITKIRR